MAPGIRTPNRQRQKGIQKHMCGWFRITIVLRAVQPLALADLGLQGAGGGIGNAKGTRLRGSQGCIPLATARLSLPLPWEEKNQTLL